MQPRSEGAGEGGCKTQRKVDEGTDEGGRQMSMQLAQSKPRATAGNQTLSPQQHCVWAARWGSPGGGAGGAGDGGTAGGAGGTGTGGTGTRGATGGTGVGGAGGTDTGGATGGTGAGGTGGAGTGGATGGIGVCGASRQESLSAQQLHEWAVRWGSPGGGAGGAGTGVELLLELEVLGVRLLSSSRLHLITFLSQPQLLPHSPLPAPSPYTAVTKSLTESREPALRPVTSVRTWRAARPRPPFVPGTHIMALRLSSIPQRVVLPSPPASSLPHVPDLEAELALSCDVLENRQFELECLAAAAPHLASKLLCPEGDPDALEILTTRSYADAITGRYSSQWQIAMDAEMDSRKVKRPPGSPPSFKARYIARAFSQPQRDYELHSLDLSTTFLQGSLHEAIWLHRPRGFTRSFLEGPSTLRLPILLATAHSTAYRPLALSSTFGRVHTSWADDQTTHHLTHCYSFSLGTDSVSWRSTRLSSVLSSSYEAEIYALAMAAQELRWLTYLLTDLGGQPRSPPVLYLHQRGRLHLSYVASPANTADVFTKALGSGDHQRFCTSLGLVPTQPHLLVS
ncbi:unnamed protein product [Closterium sp. NIES-53]